MLKRTSDPSKLKLHGLLIGIEVQIDEQSIEYITNKIHDAVSCIEGVGDCEIEHLGEMDLEDADVTDPPQGAV